MDKQPHLWKDLFSTPVLRVLDFLLQNPDLELHDSDIVSRIVGVRKSAVNLALRSLANMELIERWRQGNMKFNRLIESPLILHLKIVSNIAMIQPLVNRVKMRSVRVVLFGSRAMGEHTSGSDIDLLVVSDDEKSIRQVVRKFEFGGRIQPIVKSLDEWFSLASEDKTFYETVKKGLVLWERE